MRPLVVVEGPDAVFAGALADARTAGRRVVAGWAAAGDGTVCVGSVADAEDAAAALLAAVAGAGLVVHAVAARDVVDRFCEDLRRLGRLDHVVETEARPRPTREEAALLGLLLDGLTLGEAARQLGLARRTADRRLASAREKLGVRTTAEALVAWRGR